MRQGRFRCKHLQLDKNESIFLKSWQLKINKNVALVLLQYLSSIQDCSNPDEASFTPRTQRGERWFCISYPVLLFKHGRTRFTTRSTNITATQLNIRVEIHTERQTGQVSLYRRSNSRRQTLSWVIQIHTHTPVDVQRQDKLWIKGDFSWRLRIWWQ